MQAGGVGRIPAESAAGCAAVMDAVAAQSRMYIDACAAVAMAPLQYRCPANGIVAEKIYMLQAVEVCMK